MVSDIHSSDYTDNVSVIDTTTNKVTATVNTGKYTMNCPFGVVIGPLKCSEITDQIKIVSSNETDKSTVAIFNATEDIGVEETNFSPSDEKNITVPNNSNNTNNNNSESDNGSGSGENESRKSNSAPGFGLLGSLACLYGGWKLGKK